MTRLLFLSLISAALAAPTGQAVDPACRDVADAGLKVFTTPVHIFMTKTAAYERGKVTSSETIYLNNATYVYVNGKWRRSPTSPQSLLEMQKKEPGSDSTATCRRVREESVNGEAAVVYSTHYQTPDEKLDTQVWISKTRKLPLKGEVDMDVGGTMGKSHTDMRYDYKNVQAPAEVR
ncbi:MAG TPA: hypothetical protein VL523_06225 [Terriglobia bacterium]|nr:hypothetical protein [Terriglobia bacterium]